MAECECDVDHSVTKLGHSRSCPFFKTDQANMLQPGLLAGGCPPRHADGSEHDFNWATYNDDRSSTGVCRCGLAQIDHDMLVLP